MARNKQTKKKLLDFVERNGMATRPEIIDELRRLRGVSILSKTETRGYGCGWFRGSNMDKNKHVNKKDVAEFGMGPGPLLYQAGKDPRYLKPVTIRIPAVKCECCGKKISKAKTIVKYKVVTKGPKAGTLVRNILK